MIVRNEIEGNSYEIIGLPIFFSADGKYLVYTALKNNKWRIVVNEKEGNPYDALIVNVKNFFGVTGFRYFGLRNKRLYAVEEKFD